MKTLLAVTYLLISASIALAQAKPLHRAPPVVLKDLSGNIVKLTDLKGKVVLLNWWATWCPPCAAEMPDLARWHREHQPDGLIVIGVTYPPTNLDLVKKFIADMGIDYPIWLGTQATRRLLSPGTKIPVSVVIDRNGNIASRIPGVLTPEEFSLKVKPLLLHQ